MRIIRPTLAALALTLALVPVGCGKKSNSSNGVADKTPTEIVTAVQEAVKAAKTVHVVADIKSSTGSGISFDLKIDRAVGGSGTMTADGISFDIVRVGDKAYFKGGDDLWRKSSGARQQSRSSRTSGWSLRPTPASSRPSPG